MRDSGGEPDPQLLVGLERARVVEQERLAAVHLDPGERLADLLRQLLSGDEAGEYIAGAGARRDDRARPVDDGDREVAALEERADTGRVADVPRRAREGRRRGRIARNEGHRSSLLRGRDIVASPSSGRNPHVMDLGLRSKATKEKGATMNILAQLFENAFVMHSGIRCRSCGNAIKSNDEFGRSERACRRCRGR